MSDFTCQSLSAQSLMSALAVAAIGSSTLAQSNTILVDCTGASVASTPTNPPNVVRTSPVGTTIFPASGYTFSFNPIARGTGFFGAIAIGTTPRPLGDILNGFFVGGHRTLYGAMRNPSGTIPATIASETLAGTFAGITLSLTFRQEILATGQGQASILNITKPSLLGIAIDSGGAIYNTWTPPAPTYSEWQFEGDLLSVKQSAAAPTSGPGRIRYLDDPAFGPLLGGIGLEDEYPGTPTPTGVTQTQSLFGTVSSFALPAIGAGSTAATDGVYRTSPPRNAGAPTDSAKSRGLGLALWPNTRDFWPDDRLGQWTMVMDLLIPQASWDAAVSAPGGAGAVVVPIVEDSQNNNSASDVFIYVTQTGQARVGHSVTPAAALNTPAIQPNQWFRLAISVNHYAAQQSRVFVNGAFIGTSGSDWVYNACKSTDPRWGDVSSTNLSGSVIAPATWNAWGQFPSPWAKQPVDPEAPTASTLSLFADLTGQGQSVYIANLLLADEAMTDAQVLALGGPSGRGIMFLRPEPPTCAADFDGMNGVDVVDLFAFLDAWFAQNGGPPSSPSADFDGSGTVDVVDLFDFLDAWFAENGVCS